MRLPLVLSLPALGLLTTLSLGTWAQQDSSQADYESKLKALKSNISKLQDELRSVRDSRNSLQSELQRSETDIGDLIKKIEQIKDELKDHKKELNKLNNRRQKVRGEQQKQEQQIAHQVSTSYKLGRQSNLKLILNQDDPARVSRMLKYYDYFLSARAEKMATYLDTITELNEIEPRIKKKMLSLTRTINTLSNATLSLPTNNNSARKPWLA